MKNYGINFFDSKKRQYRKGLYITTLNDGDNKNVEVIIKNFYKDYLKIGNFTYVIYDSTLEKDYNFIKNLCEIIMDENIEFFNLRKYNE